MNQITCRCSAYKFPHRLGGGKCKGTEWAESYFETMKEACSDCNAFNNGICEVATGQESISECQGRIEMLHWGDDTKLPRTEEDMIAEYENKHFEHY